MKSSELEFGIPDYPSKQFAKTCFLLRKIRRHANQRPCCRRPLRDGIAAIRKQEKPYRGLTEVAVAFAARAAAFVAVRKEIFLSAEL
jgi:hypothetical protein